MSTFWSYVRVQLFVLLCGIVGPIFLVVYFATGAEPMMKWLFWTGLLITAADVLIALAITGLGSKKAAKTQALEATGVLALAQVVGIHETGTRINDQPLVKIDLQVSGPGITPFSTQDQVIASVSRLPMITSRKLVALVDPVTNEYQIDWQRSALVGGLMPATFSVAQDGGLDNTTYDLTGQTEALGDPAGAQSEQHRCGQHDRSAVESCGAPTGAGHRAARRLPAGRATAAAGARGGTLRPAGRCARRTHDRPTAPATRDAARHRFDHRRRVHRQAPADHLRPLTVALSSTGGWDHLRLNALSSVCGPVPTSVADPCPDVALVVARGTGEPPGMGRVMTP